MKSKKEVFSYLVFGVLTTLVNIITYALLTKVVQLDYKTATSIAWLLSVLFAFITNKLYVFNSRSFQVQTLSKEFLSFLFFRLLSYLVDIGMMIILVEWFMTDDFIAKIFANVIVVILNFFASKFFIFKRQEGH